MRLKLSATDRQACCGVFVTANSLWVAFRISNFGRVVTCKKAIVMASNIYHKKHTMTFIQRCVRLSRFAKCESLFENRTSHDPQHVYNHGKCYMQPIRHKYMQIKTCRFAYMNMRGCFTFTKHRHHSQYGTHHHSSRAAHLRNARERARARASLLNHVLFHVSKIRYLKTSKTKRFCPQKRSRDYIR